MMFECLICRGEHFSDDTATVDGCAHSICFDCIARWTSNPKQRKCPICRRVVSDIIIHRMRFPVKRNLKIVVKNFSGWRSDFHIPPKMQIRFFINLVLEYYKQRNPVRRIPSYAYGTDVFFYYDLQTIEDYHNRKVDSLGISRGDVVYIRHRIVMLINMPGSDLSDYKHAKGWWDEKLQDFLYRFLETMELSIHDYWFSYNGNIFGEWPNYHSSLEELGFASGDVIRVIRKEDDHYAEHTVGSPYIKLYRIED